MEALVISKEIRVGFSSVIMREHQRSADSKSILVLPVSRFGGGVQFVEVEEIPRVQLIVSQKFPTVAVDFVRTRLGGHVDIGSRGQAEAGVSDMRLDLEFVDGVGRRSDGETIVKPGVIF